MDGDVVKHEQHAAVLGQYPAVHQSLRARGTGVRNFCCQFVAVHRQGDFRELRVRRGGNRQRKRCRDQRASDEQQK
ncbi:hypothetical protein D3C83_62490 [compost metagenome]